MSVTWKETREQGNGEKKGTALLSFVPLSCLLLARFASPFAASLARSRVACFARHLKCRACSQAREEVASFTGERVSISIVGLMWEGKIRYSRDKKRSYLMTHADFNYCRSLSMSQSCYNWPWNLEEQSPPERYLDQRSHFPIIQ